MTNEEKKDWIDRATYYELLEKWRYAPSGDEFFVGEIGKYYEEVMVRKKELLPIEDRIRISKEIN